MKTWVMAMAGFAGLAGPAMAQSMIVRDWTAVCDGGLCRAETGSNAEGYRLQIARNYEKDYSWYVTFVAEGVAQPETGSTLAFTIDGKAMPASEFVPDDDAMSFDLATQAALDQIYPALKAGTNAEVAFTAGTEKKAVRFSLSGLAAVMLWIGEQQKRPGDDAAVAIDFEATEKVLTGAEAESLQEEIQKISMVNDCQWLGEAADPTSFAARSYRLDEATTLYAVACVRGAYQGSTIMFLRGQYGLRVLAFPEFNTELGWHAEHEIVLESYDEKSRELRTFAKARGVGDCGSTALFKWAGFGFRMLEYRYKPCADEIDENDDHDWPVIYKKQ